MTYGCRNRQPFVESYTVHGICRHTGMAISTTIPNRMERECQYQINDRYDDPGCVGCSHKFTQSNHKASTNQPV